MPRSKKYIEGEVLHRAMELFRKRGFDSTSVRDLEREMGINQFSIYASFRSKRELFLKSLENYREFAEIDLYARLFEPDANLGDLKNLLEEMLNNTDKGERLGCLVVNTTGTTLVNDSEISDELLRYYGFIRAMLRRLAERSVEEGILPFNTDIDSYASYLLGVMQGFSVGLRIMPADQLRSFLDISFRTGIAPTVYNKAPCP